MILKNVMMRLPRGSKNLFARAPNYRGSSILGVVMRLFLSLLASKWL